MEGLSGSVGNLNLEFGSSSSSGLIGLGSGTKSLSMKMRSDGTKQSLTRSALPPVSKKQHPKNIHTPKVIPKSEISRMYERLSGQFESEGFESFPNRGAIHHPSTFCVRCSAHASVCVPCADDMSNTAVTFFRKSQALGAFHLLNGAIKQAGCQTTLQSLIFYLWKNYLREANIKRIKRKEQARKKYERHLLTPTFNAWVSLAKYLIKDKHYKKVYECEERIKLLESQVQKLITERNISDFEAKKAQKSYETCLAVSEEQAATIKKLTKTLYNDQFRVLKLATFVHNVTPHLFQLINRSAKGATLASSKHVQFCQSISAASMNYVKVLKPNPKAKKAVFPPSKVPGVISWSEKAPELIAWVNHQSKNANMMTHVIGDSDKPLELDKYLPPFRDIRKLTELRNGQQLCRIVVKMLLHRINERAAVPKAPPPRSKDSPGPMVPSAPPPSSQPGVKDDPPFVFTRDHAQDIKENVAVPHGLIYITLTLMESALKCPQVSIKQIENGDPVAIEALIGSLMLISFDNVSGGEISGEEAADLHKMSASVDAVKHKIDRKITKNVAAKMLSFPDFFFRDEEKEKRLEAERQLALENKDKIRKEKREADKAARLEARRRASHPDVDAEGKETEEKHEIEEEGDDDFKDSNADQKTGSEEEKGEEKNEIKEYVNPKVEFVDSFAEKYADITHIIDVYFGTAKSEKLEELTAHIGTLEEDMKTVTDQMSTILRKEKVAFSNLQFSIHTNSQIALSNTSRMLSAAAAVADKE